MKRYLLILTAGLAAMAACQSVMEEPFTPEEFMDEGVVFEACASSPLAVRSHFIDADEGTAKEGTLYWDEGEKVGVLSLFWYDIPSFDSMVWGTDWVSKFDAHMVELSADVENGHFVGRPFTKYVQSDLATVEIDPTDGNQAKLHSSLTMSQWLMNVDEAIRIGIYDFIMIYPMTAKPAPVVMYKMQSGTPTIGVPVKIATDQYVSEGFGKYQLCMDSGFDYSQMDRAFGLLSSEELLQGNKVVFDNVNPITPLLEFDLKSDYARPVPISYMKIRTDDTPIAGDAYASAQGMAKFLVYSHWADDGDTGKSTSNTITLHFPDATTISSTASTEKYYVSLFPSYFDGKVETFNNDGSFNSNANYREYLQSYGGETLYFEAYDASNNLVMTAQKTIPAEGFKAGHRYKFSLEMESLVGDQYHLEHTGTLITLPDGTSAQEIVRASGSAGATLAGSFNSYMTRYGDETEYPVAISSSYEFAEADENGNPVVGGDGNIVWSTTQPAGIQGLAIDGAKAKTIKANIAQNANPAVKEIVSEMLDHARNLQSHGSNGFSSSSPQDLSLYDINRLATPRSSGKPTTANCYIVDRAGWYMFPVVYGNAIDYTKSSASLYTNGVNQYAYKDAASPSSNSATVWHTFQRYNGGTITSPYILDDTGLSISDVEAVIVWQDVANAAGSFIDNVSVVSISSSGVFYNPNNSSYKTSVPYIKFRIPDGGSINPDELMDPSARIQGIREGNALIALRKKSDKVIIWSWHIWITDGYDLDGDGDGDGLDPIPVSTYNVGTVNMMPLNLGWCSSTNTTRYKDRIWFVRIRQGEGEATPLVFKIVQKTSPSKSGASGTYYQWGRKDPMLPSSGMPGTNQVNKAFHSPNNQYTNLVNAANTAVAFSNSPAGNATSAIQHPYIMYYGENTSGWMSSDVRPLNLWNMAAGANTGDRPVSKTVYDPCPPGYSVPRGAAFTGFTTDGTNVEGNLTKFRVEDRNLDGVITSDDYERGWYFYTDNSKTRTIYFPTSGYRKGASGELEFVTGYGYYWSAALGTQYDGYDMDIANNRVQPMSKYSRSRAFSIRPTKE